MTLSQEMNEKIEQAMAALDRDSLLRSGMALNDFVTDYTRLIAQAVKDLAMLEAAGFDGSQMPRYAAYLEKLTLEQGERVAEEGVVTPNEAAFAARMPSARSDKKRLMAMGRFVVKKSKSPEAKRVYGIVRRGSGDVDTLSDNVAMVAFARKYKEYVVKVNPGGRPLTDEELSRIEADSLALLALKGVSVTDSKAPSSQIERRNRIISLCVAASQEIRIMAEMAYFDNLDYYNRYYAASSKPSTGSSPNTASDKTKQTAKSAASSTVNA